ncbi:serine/arginine repetitive matrix protein 3-like [Piliocolobus tephrosceles]|uniref:serine/arginine repetitive matrix protein 3-like n=1 Tax=Piliocolobus tephrosceles TaxID=591936 RepID=UPI000E6B4D65|nr:serine/arginine repetitive matrix protein 3-like [Piliocolobus tephrosceles]
MTDSHPGQRQQQRQTSSPDKTAYAVAEEKKIQPFIVNAFLWHLARVSGEAPPRGAREARNLSPAAGGALCGGGSESHLLAAERQGRGRRRRRGKRRRRQPIPLAGAHSRGLRSPQLSACTGPSPPARPSLPATPRQPPLQPPALPGGARPGRGRRRRRRRPEPPASLRGALGARRRLEVPGSRLGAPAPLNSPGEAAREDERGGAASPGEREPARKSEPKSERRERHHARLEEEYPHLLAGGGAGERKKIAVWFELEFLAVSHWRYIIVCSSHSSVSGNMEGFS